MRRIRLAIVGLIVIAVVSAGIWWAVHSSSSEASTDILTSGFIEARDVSVALEVGGRIVSIAVDEGNEVQAGDTIVKLDTSLLDAQKQQAEANVQLAQANLEQTVASRDGAGIAWQRALDIQSKPLEFDPKVIAARGELDTAELSLKKVRADSDLVISTAEIRLDTAKQVLWNYRSLEHTVGNYGTGQERIINSLIAEEALAQAEMNLNYQKELVNFWSIPAAELRRDNAQRTLQSLLESNDFAAKQASNAYQTANATVNAAQKELAQAKASLEVINVQLNKSALASPVSGIVVTKNAEVGEIAQPGAPILTVADLEEVTLTAYVPESKIGLVKLGQETRVSVDSYPGGRFTGEVVYISPQAQFTPKNVQLKEEREKTVFAVKIRLANPDQKLKPGMPADARILTDSEG